MFSQREIVVLGPTGNIGSALSRLLMQANISFRTGNRHDFDYYQPATYAPLLNGATDLFLLVPFSQGLTEVTEALLEVASKCGIKRIVKISALGADATSLSPIQKLHGIADEKLLQSKIPSVILRPNAFMQNFIQFYGESIKKRSLVSVPAGNAKVSFIDAEDVAKAAFTILNDFSITPQILNLTGPELLTFHEAAEILSRSMGKLIQYLPVDSKSFQIRMESFGIPTWNVKALIAMYLGYQKGQAAVISSDFAKVTGQKPKTFEDFVTSHLQVWKERAAS